MNLCACMGPQRGDPYCPCEMKRRGLEPTGPSEEEYRALAEALRRYGWKDNDEKPETAQ